MNRRGFLSALAAIPLVGPAMAKATGGLMGDRSGESIIPLRKYWIVGRPLSEVPPYDQWPEGTVIERGADGRIIGVAMNSAPKGLGSQCA